MEYVFTHDGTYARQWFSTLTDTVRGPGFDPNIYSYSTCTINYQTGNFINTALIIDGFQQNASASRVDPEYAQTMYHYTNDFNAMTNNWYSTSYAPFEGQISYTVGQTNQKYNGSKLIGDNFNIPSLDTIDQGPVVEYIEGNPNTIFSVEPSYTGELDVR